MYNKDRLQEARNEYERKVTEIKREQASCRHDWNETKYDPEKKNEPYGFKTVGQGSDVWSEPEGYKEVAVPRWSRTCKKCGYTEYTYTQEPVISEYKPKFN